MYAESWKDSGRIRSRLHDVTGGRRVPERATTSKPKRKAGVDPAAAQGREVPSKPSTFSGVVCNGQKPGGAAEREESMGRHTGMHQAPEASHTEHARDQPYQNLAQRGGIPKGPAKPGI